MDSFDLHYKILSICEHLMQARRKIESMTDEERKIAVSLLERLLAESRDKKGGLKCNYRTKMTEKN